MKTFGFIGTGTMGGALARAAAKTVSGCELFLSDYSMEKAAQLAADLGANASDNASIAADCDCVVLGVKPQMLRGVLNALAPILAERKTPFLLVSMAAGVSIAEIQDWAGGAYPVLRIMPNTPVSVGAGLILTAASAEVGIDAVDGFKRALSAAGRFDDIPESLFDAAGSLSGCGPAYAALFLEGLTDGAVACGVPRTKAMTYAAQMLLGTAKLQLETGIHPGALKDAVCSPGGTTIAGVRALEQHGFRAAAMESVEAACERTKELTK